MLQNGLFDNVMTDVSGKVRLESEDPRWIQLFSTKNIANLVDAAADISWYGNRLIEHNPVTGNLIQLLEQTVTRLNQVTSRKTVPANQFLEQCCISLHLSSLVMHHMIISLSHNAVCIMNVNFAGARFIHLFSFSHWLLAGKTVVPNRFMVPVRSQVSEA